MTTDGLKPDLGGRIGSLLLSGALHLVAGLALFYASNQGAPLRGPSGGDSGQILVVELIPLDRAGATAGSIADQDGRDTLAERDPPPSGEEHARDIPHEPKASGPATSDLAASGEESGDARQMADLPSAEVLAYRHQLESHLARYRVYPADARAAGRQGVVTVYFTTARDGKVLRAWVETSSGVSDLDAEALAAILRAQPLPAFPQNWPGRLDVSLPVTFRLG